ncbi:hypothetical protein [Mycoplasmopsis cynos]|uniref:hypothetical protein n=1 Tax=Mycoplasmopsis cynos TaxID=171284 RepID=UPI002205B336|nr:hypothetical protein [Mycoplasmopsis cynos]UWV81716.1 hypothetical protein NW065_00940 [Mycoplasmopsis cynos]
MNRSLKKIIASFKTGFLARNFLTIFKTSRFFNESKTKLKKSFAPKLIVTKLAFARFCFSSVLSCWTFGNNLLKVLSSTFFISGSLNSSNLIQSIIFVEILNSLCMT